MSDDTSRDNPAESAVDRAIDRAVRAMLNVDPAPGFRGRVLARLERSPRPTMLFPRFVMAASAFAAVVLAVLLLRPSPPPAPAPAPTTTAVEPAATLPPPAALPSATAAAVVSPAPEAATRGARPALTGAPIRMPRIANVFGAPGERISAAAAEVEDVVFAEAPAPVGASPEDLPGPQPLIPVPQITVTPLHVERISVAPMPVRR